MTPQKDRPATFNKTEKTLSLACTKHFMQWNQNQISDDILIYMYTYIKISFI